MAGQATGQKVNFFRTPAIYHWLWVTAGMGLFTVVTFFPGILPYSRLGAFGSFLHYLGYNHHTLLAVGYIVAWGVHVIEASYAWSFCKKLNLTEADTLKWTLQTFAMGFPSLLIIKAKLKKSQKKQ